MGEKRLILVYLSALVFAILLIDFVSANFVCGKVKDVGEVSASWFDVSVYYPEFPNKKTSCKISPEEGKYCCDPEAIKGVTWKIGKSVNAEIFDFEKGYVAGLVSLIISGEGFDVFPEMQLDKAITVYSPNSSLILDIDRV